MNTDHYELLRSEGVGAFFAAVGALTVGAAALVGVASTSWTTLAWLVLAAEAWTALAWGFFAPFCRDVWQLPSVVLDFNVAIARTLVAYVARGKRPLFPEWTLRYELVRAIMHALRGVKYAPNLVQPRNARYFRRQYELIGKLAEPSTCKAHGTRVETVQLNGLEHLWLRKDQGSRCTADADAKPTRLVVLYYHGGGFVLFTPHFFVGLCNRLRTAIVAKLAPHLLQHPDRHASVEVFLANYRKSPDFQFPVPQEDALLVYEYLIEHEKLDPSQIILAGDSAGAALALSTMLRLRDKGARQPAGALLSCPCTDLTFDASDSTRDRHCILPLPLMSAFLKAFHPTPHDRSTWKDAAAIHCDLRGVAPALIQVGAFDTIYDNSVKLFAKAQADRLTTWELDEFARMPHAFTALSEAVLPDAQRGIDHLAAFATRIFLQALP